MTKTDIPHDFQADIDAVGAIPLLGTILEATCRTTGMRFAAVARVTRERWVCCASKDDLALGLAPGSELWGEAAHPDHRGIVAIHDAPQGFGSYLSVPIVLADGSLFGALCSIDPDPDRFDDPGVIGLFELFARLIAHELDIQARLAAMQQENEALQDRFRAGLGHDMKNTLAALEAGARLLAKTPLNERARMIVGEMESAARRLSQQIEDAMQPRTD